LYWADDDLGVASEAIDLKRVFEEQYNFETDTYLIPSVDAEQLLMQRIFEFRKEHATPENLLIVYYGGHAEQAEHDHCIWRRFVVLPSQIMHVLISNNLVV
jgi:Caspase domain